MGRMKMRKKAPVKRSEDACVFCNSEEDNEEVYGKMLKKLGLSIHYFCMLFSSGLWQRGKRDRDGILGFMPADIYREKKRGGRLTCQYCRKKGATIGCVITNCRKTYHFQCGREAGGLFQFFQEFRSYCPDHRPGQDTPTSDRLAFYGTAKSTCSICMLSVEARASNDTLRSPCCRKAWFHRNCIQRYALSAGAYFFKCPLCNNKELFEAEMLEFGIYIPEQDAAWEQDPSAYQELLERYNRCDTDHCQCPLGREHDGAAGSRWEILLCHWCGSSGTHTGCHGFIKVGKEHLCKECADFSVLVEQKKMTKTKKCSPSHMAIPAHAELQQRLEQRLAASLRDQRAARRQSTSQSSDSPQVTVSVKRGRRAKLKQKNPDSDTVPSTRVERSIESAALPEFLQDHRLTSSTPVVYVERAGGETEISETEDIEEPSVASADRVQAGHTDTWGSSKARPESSYAQMRGALGGRSIVEECQHAEMTKTSSENTVMAQSSSDSGFESLPPAQEKYSQALGSASQQVFQHANQTQDSSDCAEMTGSSPWATPSSEFMTGEVASLQNPQMKLLTVPSQFDESTDLFVQNAPSCEQLLSSLQHGETQTSVQEVNLQAEHVADDCELRQHVAKRRRKKRRQKVDKKPFWKNGSTRQTEILKLLQCSGSNQQKNAGANLSSFQNIAVEDGQRVTRSQSIANRRLTRSASGQSQSLKRSRSLCDKQVCDWSKAKRCKTSLKQDKAKMMTCWNKVTVGYCWQKTKSIYSVCAQNGHVKALHIKSCQESVSVSKQNTNNSDGNNNLSVDGSVLESNNQQSDCNSPGWSGMITRSGLFQCPFLHYEKSLDTKKNKNWALSDVESKQLPTSSRDGKDFFTSDKAQSIKKNKIYRYTKIVSQNNSTLSDSISVIKVQQYGQPTVQAMSHCSIPGDMFDCERNEGCDDSKTGLPTHAEDLQSNPSTMNTLSVPCRTSGRKHEMAEQETSSCTSVNGLKRKHEGLLTMRSPKKRGHRRKRSLQNRMVNVSVCTQDQNPVDPVTDQQADYNINLPFQQDAAPLLPLSPSSATLEYVQERIPGPVTFDSFLQTMCAMRTCFIMSPTDNLPVTAQPEPVLLWNIQLQRRPTAFRSSETGFEGHPIVFPSLFNRRMTSDHLCSVLPQLGARYSCPCCVQCVDHHHQQTCVRLELMTPSPFFCHWL